MEQQDTGNSGQNKDPETKGQIVNLKASMTAVSQTSVAELEVWLAASFAERWFTDALHEARDGKGQDSRRREVLFAVCFAESYLVEWVRDQVLSKDFQEFNKYFPPGSKITAVDKWKEIPKKLHKNGRIPNRPKLGEVYWENWLKLVSYRDGLVHAVASRPESDKQSDPGNPTPALKVLDDMSPGWPTQVVVELVRHLHQAVGTQPPNWLVKP